ncbi:MAG: IscS subfamily cysteine desulfurase [Candidatus Omnitrophica bacterium]|nr:IscS subfamily cysteine desulfurase [Candidatus Omnitrophota bacterium]
MKLPIYMDYHATTPVDPRVLQAMMPVFSSEFGNAASKTHAFGWHAQELVDKARAQIAQIIGATPDEIVFTSGATEANNIALKGAAEVYRQKGNHMISQVTEHKSVLDPLKYLEKHGLQVTFLPVDRYGRINLEDLKKAITDKTILISVMAANNEIGTLQPVEKIGKIAKEKGIIFHVDAAQAVGKIPVNVEKQGIDLLSFTAHKLYGPKGTGALYVRKKNPHVRVAPMIHGGGHEGGIRSGTLNVPGIVGFGKACEIAAGEMKEESARLAKLRDRLQAGLEKELDQIHINGHPTERLANNLSVSFAYVDGQSLLTGVGEKVAVSAGSACTSGIPEPSFVLKALGLREDLTHTAIRFGLGRFNTEEEIDETIACVVNVVRKLRAMSPFYQGGKKS